VFVQGRVNEWRIKMDANLEATHRERRVVTVNEAALMLRISRGAAYEAARRKEIPTIRIGRRLLVPLAALDRMLAGDPGSA
jgi:excisionase family DNA binding protein